MIPVSKEEKLECVKRIGEKFTQRTNEEKDFIAGYIVGRTEERAKQEIERGRLKEA